MALNRESNRRTIRYLPQVLLATGLMAGVPVALVWALYASGAITSLPLLIAIAVGAALLIGQAGAAAWKRTPAAGDLLFGELLVWGWLRRLRAERRLASALATIGPAAGAGELEPAQQAERLERLTAALEASDPYTHGHSRRVARYSATIAKRLHLPPEQVARIRTAAAVHDVGKINTPPAVLRKKGALTDEEFDVIKQHPVDGAQMVAALDDAELTRSVLHHHERLDGGGYPAGIAGEEIPVGARIIAVADTFDAIASARPYRRAKTHRDALGVLATVSGAQLDPDAVRAFLGHYSDSRPLAAGTALAIVPERLASVLGGGVNAAGTAAAGVAAAGLAALGIAIADPPREAEPDRGAPAPAAQAAPLSGLGYRAADRAKRPNSRPSSKRSQRRASAPQPTAEAATPADTTLAATATAPAPARPTPAIGGEPTAVTVPPPPRPAPAPSPPPPEQPDDGGTEPDAPPPSDGPHLLPHLPVGPHLPHVPGFED